MTAVASLIRPPVAAVTEGESLSFTLRFTATVASVSYTYSVTPIDGADAGDFSGTGGSGMLSFASTSPWSENVRITVRALNDMDINEVAERLLLTVDVAGASFSGGATQKTVEIVINNDPVGIGSTASEQLRGARANDTLYGREGDDTLFGVNGDDQLFGEDGDDRVYGGNGNDALEGAAGHDVIFGDKGNDWLRGGAGSDTLFGGKGADQFVIEGPFITAEADTILDFRAQDDAIVLAGSEFSVLASNPDLGGSFMIGKSPRAADDHLVYSQRTGELFWDADGTGSSAMVQIVQFNPGTRLGADDFILAWLADITVTRCSPWLISNDVPEIRELFVWAAIEEVSTTYAIAGGGKAREGRAELLISTN